MTECPYQIYSKPVQQFSSWHMRTDRHDQYAIVSCRSRQKVYVLRYRVSNCHGLLIKSPGFSFCDMCALFTEGLSALMTKRDSPVGIATGYELDDWGAGVWIKLDREFYLLHVVKTGSGAHPAFCPMGTGGYFLGSETAEAWSWPLTSI
jgi:hypothetical protein